MDKLLIKLVAVVIFLILLPTVIPFIFILMLPFLILSIPFLVLFGFCKLWDLIRDITI